MQHRILLVIDDNKSWANITAHYFTDFGYKVITAGTCAEGYALAQLHKPACILLDYYLPDDDGCVCAANIRGNPELKKTLIVMISNDENQELPAYNDYKLDGFLSKDARLEQIKAKVESLMRRVGWDRDMVMHCDLRLDGVSLEVYRGSKLVNQLSSEQFKLFSFLLEKSPSFVGEDELARQIYSKEELPEKNEGVRGVAQRLRENLGPQLGRRIKAKIGKGWIYLQPRART